MRLTQKNIQKTLVSMALSLTLILPAYADINNEKQEISDNSISNFVKNSYIVTFKKPEKGFSPLIEIPTKANRGITQTPFGEHSSWQTRQEVADKINLKGEVVSIFDNINAIHVKMDAKEAYRLSRDKRVLLVEQDMLTTTSTTKTNSGWGLGRIDEQTSNSDDEYDYSFTGSGRTIYVLDSGLNIGTTNVDNEFGGRASVIWDINGLGGDDCQGHGSRVSSAAAGSTYGVAKGATLIMAKITNACTIGSNVSTSVLAFNWLATNAPEGTIVNWSHAFSNGLNSCGSSLFSTALENAIIAAHDAGIIVVVAAGNDNCNTANFSPTNIPEAFVVGATNNIGFSNSDRKANFSRTGWNISTFSPGDTLLLMGANGNPVTDSGTSFSAPYIAGVFAVACEAAGTLCNSGNTASLYDAIRGTGTLNTVTNTNGTPLTGATSRFISQQW